MSGLPAIHVTETSLTILNPDAFFDTPEHAALLAWSERHGLNPAAMPAGEPIVRNVDAKSITYVTVELGGDGSIIVGSGDVKHHQATMYLDESPAPWPDVIAAHIGARS